MYFILSELLLSKLKKKQILKCRQIADFGTVKENKCDYILESSWQYRNPQEILIQISLWSIFKI